jgi:hypothetical protein
LCTSFRILVFNRLHATVTRKLSVIFCAFSCAASMIKHTSITYNSGSSPEHLRVCTRHFARPRQNEGSVCVSVCMFAWNVCMLCVFAWVFVRVSTQAVPCRRQLARNILRSMHPTNHPRQNTGEHTRLWVSVCGICVCDDVHGCLLA